MQQHEISLPTVNNAPVIPAPTRTPESEDTSCIQLTAREEAQVLAMIENPPAPNAAALKAAQRFLQKHG